MVYVWSLYYTYLMIKTFGFLKYNTFEYMFLKKEYICVNVMMPTTFGADIQMSLPNGNKEFENVFLSGCIS